MNSSKIALEQMDVLHGGGDVRRRQQRRRQRTVKYHMLKHKYVAHPNDVDVDLYVKNHMQFLHRNYPSECPMDVWGEGAVVFCRTMDGTGACRELQSIDR